MTTLKKKPLKISLAASFLALCIVAALSVCPAAFAQTPPQNSGAQAQQDAPSPEENRAAYLNFLQGSVESGFMDEWRGQRPMKSMEEIGEYMANFNIWAFACRDAESFNLNAQEKQFLANFRKKAQAVQTEAFPKLRDAFGPVLRQQIKQFEINARTIGKGYRKVEFSGQPFSNADNIDQFHDQVVVVLSQLRFSAADYKVERGQALVRSITVGDLKDGDMILWMDDFNYELIK